MGKNIDKPQAVYSIIAVLALVFMKIVEVKPNRIASGERFTAYEFIGWPVLLIGAGFLLIALLSLSTMNEKGLITTLAGALLFTALLYFIGQSGQAAAVDSSSIRVSFSMGFYILLVMVYLLFGHVMAKKDRYLNLEKGISLLIFITLAVFVYTGVFDEFSILKEYQIKKNQFVDSFTTHLFLSLGSVTFGSLVAIPLGYLAYRKKNLESAVMVPLSIVETIPSLSLFGILLVPLASLGRIDFFRAFGISGIGWAPAFVALTLYTLLPIGRNTLVGFSTVGRDVIEAAQGMGMSRKQIFRKIEFPLALPIIITGVRIALVQTIGGAVLAGLVGGGGLGTFVFLGLAEASPDLVLLGVIPIVLLTLTMDKMLKLLIERIRRRK
ncbi:ABC transporter permease [Proteiniclasticum sp. C24MP]|uniref:ABC transporter permease n=1 Tax=Proteiniclasticum sp. C24MP TaxID=3374101 RepID=UPI003754A3A8